MGRIPSVARWLLAAALALFMLWRMLSTYGGSIGDRRHATGKLPAAAPLFPSPGDTEGQYLADSVAVVAGQPHDGTVGFITDITIDNHSGTTITDPTLDCAGLGESGATIGHVRTGLTVVIPPRRTSTLPNVTIRFLQRNVASARCSIVSHPPDR